MIPVHYRINLPDIGEVFLEDKDHAIHLVGEENVEVLPARLIIKKGEQITKLGSKLSDKAQALLAKTWDELLSEDSVTERACRVLIESHITNVKNLVLHKTNDLLKYRNFGKKTLIELEQLLTDNDLRFGMTESDF